ncbi:MAG: acetyl-CoA carboxylase biotin carboxyl carrier protein [Bacteroidota bacterium]
MNLKQIQDLIKFVSKAGVSEVSLETKEVKITIKTGSKVEVAAAPILPQVVAVAPVAAPVQQIAAAPVATAEKIAADAKTSDESKYITIKSPMIGTFYRTPSPDKPPFVNVGDEIKVGKVICIIEAMKLFNEIESEVSGTIVKVLVDNSTPVEYDQPLFLVNPA